MSDFTKARYSYISFAKVIGILGVTLYHCILFFSGSPFVPLQADKSSAIVVILTPFFDTLFVPGFMFCSGFLFAKGATNVKRNFGQTILERAVRLLYPYYVIGLIWLVPMYTIFDVPCFGRPDHAGFLEGLKAMALGQFSDHLWFMWGLFWTTLLFCFLLPLCRKPKYHPVLFVIITVAAVLEHYFVNGIPYFKLFSAGSYNWVFFAGMICYYYRYRLFGQERKKVWLLFWLDLILVLILVSPSILTSLSSMDWISKFPAVKEGLSAYSGEYAKISGDLFALDWMRYAAGGFFIFLVTILTERYGLMDRIFGTKIWDFTYKHNLLLYLFNLPLPHLYFRLFYEKIGLPVWPTILLITICTFPSLYALVWIVGKITFATDTGIKKLFRKEK